MIRNQIINTRQLFKASTRQVKTMWHKIRIIRQVFSPVFYAVALSFMGVIAWENFKSTNVSFATLDYRIVLTVFFGLVVSIWLGAINWGIFAVLFQLDGGWLWHFRTHLTSNITKYIPGSIWFYVNKGVLSSQRSHSYKAVFGAILLEMVMAISSGTALSMFVGGTAQTYLPIQENLSVIVWWLVGLLILLLTYAIFAVGIASATNVTIKTVIFQRVSAIGFLALVTNLFLGWIIQAISLQYITTMLGASFSIPQPYWIFSYCLAVVVGTLVLFVPNGIGVRESMLVILLMNGNVSISLVIASAVILRIITIGSEFVALVLFLWLQRVKTA